MNKKLTHILVSSQQVSDNHQIYLLTTINLLELQLTMSFSINH